MKENLQAITDLQKKAWDGVSNGWKKWNEFTMNFLKPTGGAIIKALDINGNDVVLDIASGTGEPGFQLQPLQKMAGYMPPICLKKCYILPAIMLMNVVSTTLDLKQPMFLIFLSQTIFLIR